MILVFKEEDCPKYDISGDVFNRLVFAPMRSKFVFEMPLQPVDHTFLWDIHISYRFPLWRSALLDLLLDHVGV
jgi:hypothetical protein